MKEFSKSCSLHNNFIANFIDLNCIYANTRKIICHYKFLLFIIFAIIIFIPLNIFPV